MNVLSVIYLDWYKHRVQLSIYRAELVLLDDTHFKIAIKSINIIPHQIPSKKQKYIQYFHLFSSINSLTKTENKGRKD